MKKRLARGLALFLTLCMLLSTVSFAVFATEDANQDENDITTMDLMMENDRVRFTKRSAVTAAQERAEIETEEILADYMTEYQCTQWKAEQWLRDTRSGLETLSKVASVIPEYGEATSTVLKSIAGAINSQLMTPEEKTQEMLEELLTAMNIRFDAIDDSLDDISAEIEKGEVSLAEYAYLLEHQTVTREKLDKFASEDWFASSYKPSVGPNGFYDWKEDLQDYFEKIISKTAELNRLKRQKAAAPDIEQMDIDNKIEEANKNLKTYYDALYWRTQQLDILVGDIEGRKFSSNIEGIFYEYYLVLIHAYKSSTDITMQDIIDRAINFARELYSTYKFATFCRAMCYVFDAEYMDTHYDEDGNPLTEYVYGTDALEIVDADTFEEFFGDYVINDHIIARTLASYMMKVLASDKSYIYTSDISNEGSCTDVPYTEVYTEDEYKSVYNKAFRDSFSEEDMSNPECQVYKQKLQFGELEKNMYIVTNNRVNQGDTIFLNAMPAVYGDMFDTSKFVFEAIEGAELVDVDNSGKVCIKGSGGSFTIALKYFGGEEGAEDIYQIKFIINSDSERFFSGGNGTVGNPYLISNEDDLRDVANHNERIFRITNDLLLKNSSYPIIPVLNGDIDGAGHWIFGFSLVHNADTIWDENDVCGFVNMNNGQIRNINFNDPHIDNYVSVPDSCDDDGRKDTFDIGVVCGRNNPGAAIENVYVRRVAGSSESFVRNELNFNGNAIDFSLNIGGICGRNLGVIRKCSAINGNDNRLVTPEEKGTEQEESFYDLYSTGSIHQSDDAGDANIRFGGIAGVNETSDDSGDIVPVIEDCYVRNMSMYNSPYCNLRKYQTSEREEYEYYDDIRVRMGTVVGQISAGILRRYIDIDSTTDNFWDKVRHDDKHPVYIDRLDFKHHRGQAEAGELAVTEEFHTEEATDEQTDYKTAIETQTFADKGWRRDDSGSIYFAKKDREEPLSSAAEHITYISPKHIELETIPIYEYAIAERTASGTQVNTDELNWVSEPKFSDLKTDTTYLIYLRYKANDIYNTSPASSPMVITTTPVVSAKYIDTTWNDRKKQVIRTFRETKEAIELKDTYPYAEWRDGFFYVVKGKKVSDEEDAKKEMTYDKRVIVKGDVSLILAEGTVLNVPKGITVEEGSKLNVYAQSLSGENIGVLEVSADSHDAAIGGVLNGSFGEVAIHGGIVNANGGVGYSMTEGGGPGIGGVGDNPGGKVEIYDGLVNATGGWLEPGIKSQTLELNDKIGSVEIFGGTVNATGGEAGAGIGTGERVHGAGDITIHNGNVNATGGAGGAGIGGSSQVAFGGNIKIENGTVIAKGGYNAAGIGGGVNGNGANFTFIGGNITAEGAHGGVGLGAGVDGKDNGTINFKSAAKIKAGSDAAHAEEVTLDEYTNYRRPYIQIESGKTNYLDRVWDSEKQGYVPENKSVECKPITQETVTEVLSEGTYAISGEVEFSDLAITGNVTLILTNGSRLKAVNGLSGLGSLKIYAQTDGDNKGVLEIDPDGDGTGINGSVDIYGGDVYINGYVTGDVNVYGGYLEIDSSKTSNKAIIGKLHTYVAHALSSEITDNEHNRCTQTDDSFNRGNYKKLALFTYPEGDWYRLSYYDYQKKKQEGDEKTCYSYTEINGEWGSRNLLELSNGWYLVRGNVEYDSPIKISGQVNIILTDGSKLVGKCGFVVEEGNSLNIFAQSHLENIGELEATGTNGSAGIGTSGSITCGIVRIYGGKVTAIGNGNSAGIGGGNGGKVFVIGGEVIANGAPAIGGGNGASRNGNFDIKGAASIQAGTRSDDTTEVTLRDYIRNRYPYVHIKTIADGIPYYEGHYNQSSQKTTLSLVACKDYTEVTNSQKPATMSNGWYYVIGDNVEYDEVISVQGDVHIIVANDSVLNATKGIVVPEGSNLSIYAQDMGSNAGRIIATGANGAAGIGSTYEKNGGNITVHSGNVTAIGSGDWADGGAGIGGGSYGNGGTFTIYSGHVTAKAAESGGGAGVGGGYYGTTGPTNLYGGSLEAIGSAIYYPEEWGMGFDPDFAHAIGDGVDNDYQTQVNVAPQFVIYGNCNDDYPELWTADKIKELRYMLAYRQEDAIPYIDCWWDSEKNEVVSEEKTIPHDWQSGQKYLEITNENSAKLYEMNSDVAEWYYVTGDNARLNEGAVVKGNVNLVLANGSKLTASDIMVNDDTGSLTIYAQSNGENMGELLLNPERHISWCGLGTYGHENAAGSITICGGKITAYGGENAPGIGSPFSYYGGNLTIYNGDICAYGGEGCPGIGAPEGRARGDVKIYGGRVTAVGDSDSDTDIGNGYNYKGGTKDLVIAPYASVKAYTTDTTPVNPKGEAVALNTVELQDDEEFLINGKLFPYTDHMGEKTLYPYISENDVISKREFDADEISLSLNANNSFAISLSGKDKGKGVVVVVLYDNGNMTDMKDVQMFYPTSEENDFESSFKSNGGYMMVYWWDNIDNANPFCKSVGASR